MTFLELMNHLFALQKAFPDMDWDVEARAYSPSQININIPISFENAEMLIQAQQMFAPVEQ